MTQTRFISHALVLALGLCSLIDLSCTAAAQTAAPNLPGFGMARIPAPVSPQQAEGILAQRQVHIDTIQAFSRQSLAVGGSNAPANAEIAELARALRFDPDLIYKYVHDQIELEPMFGLHKGSFGALLDGRGTAFDQANLMVDLLRESGYTASYVFGEIRLNPTELTALLGVNSDPVVVSRTLTGGGIPATVFTSDGTANGTLVLAQLSHVWVKVNIGGTDYVFDPALKSYTFTSPINLSSAMGYNRTSFLTKALFGATQTADYIQNVNRVDIRSQVSTAATNLVSHIKVYMPASRLRDVIGGKRIDPAPAQLRQTSLPYQYSITTEWTTDIPAQYQSTLRIRHLGIDHTFSSRDIYGRRLTLFYNGLNQPELRLDGTLVATGTAGTLGSSANIIFDVDHPFPQLNGAYGDDVGFTRMVTVGGSYLLVNGWGKTGQGPIRKRKKWLRDYSHAGLASDSEPILGETLAVVAYTWMAEGARITDIGDQILNVLTFSQHTIGVAGQDVSPYVDLQSRSVTASLDTRPTGNYAPSETASHDASGFVLSALEHGVVEQTQPFNAVSTVKLLDLANTQSNKLFDVTSANYNSISPQLIGYSSSELSDVESFINAGFRLLLPENGNLTVDQWTGYGFFGFFENASGRLPAFIIQGGLNGGYGTTPGDASETDALSSIIDAVESLIHVLTFEPIDLVTGSYLYSHQDISLGRKQAPLGLTLKRSYNSDQRLEDGPLGLGWRHNYLISAIPDSNGFQGMGDDSPIDAAASIAAFYILQDILFDGLPKDRLAIAAVVGRWLMDELTDNVVFVARPERDLQFVKLPDGSFNPPPGVADRLTVDVDGSYLLTTVDGNEADFDTEGRLTALTDPNGNSTTLSYGAGGTLDTVSNNFGRTLAFTYVGGRISQISDGTGRSVSYEYDAAGNLTGFTNAENDATSFEYDIDGRMTKIFYPSFPTTAFVTNIYDTLDRVQSQTDAANNTWQYFFGGSRSEEVDPLGHSQVWVFDEQGNMVEKTDALGNSVASVYDGQNRLVAKTLPEGNRTTIAYDEANHKPMTVTEEPKPGSGELPIIRSFTYEHVFNHIKTATDPRGYTTEYFYDTNGNLERIEQPLVGGVSPITTFTYTGRGQVQTETDAEGMVTRNTYDPVTGDLLGTVADDGVLGLNLATDYGYDAVGNQTSQTDPLEHTTTYGYDNERRLTQIISPAPFNFFTNKDYDEDGRLLQIERQTDDPLNPWQITQFTYYPTGKRQTATSPENSITSLEYDPLLRLMRTTDAEGRITEREYDAVGRLYRLKRILNLQTISVEEYAYTANGLKQSVLDGENNQTTYVYDDFDRLLRTVYADTSFEGRGYDAAGNLISLSTRAGETITFSYDALNRLDVESLPDLTTIDYDYDLVGRMSLVTSNAEPASYEYDYDTAGRLTQVTRPDLKTVGYGHDAAGNQTRLTYPDGSYVSYVYDELDRVMEVQDEAGAPLAQYSYDPLYRIKTVDYANGAQTTYSYEVDNDLSQVAHAYTAGSVTLDYFYNLVNQRTDVQVDDDSYLWRPSQGESLDYVSNLLNQYTDIGAVPFTYDGNGNLSGDGVSSYIYDAENRLISAVTPQHLADYTYDPFGRRSEKDVDGAVTRYVYAGDTVIAEYDGNGQLQARYVPGIGIDKPVLMDRGGGMYYYHYDGSGSVMAVTDAIGTVAESYAYSPFGESADANAVGNPYRYTGRRLDPETGLYYYRARYFDPALGRFLQPDPAGYVDGINLYTYVGNDPLNRLDPSGLDYIDFNLTIGLGPGISVGIMYSMDGNYYPYFGLGATLTPISASFTGSPNDPIPGMGPAVSLGVGSGIQVGFTEPNRDPDPRVISEPGSFFFEGGGVVGATAMIQFIYGPYDSFGAMVQGLLK